MIGIVDVEVQAANPQMPLCPFVAFVGSPSSVRVRNVPGNVGSWNITKVYVSANYPDNSIQSRECTRVGEIYVGTLPACNAVGKGANGFVVSADGVDESGNAVTGYVLGKGDLEILDADGAITPGVTTHYVHGLDEQPSNPHEYDIYKDGDTWKIYFDGAWGPLAPVPAALDDTVTRTSANGVKSSGIWSAIWGALTALPTGFASLYDWCVAQLAGKASTADATLTVIADAWEYIISDPVYNQPELGLFPKSETSLGWAPMAGGVPIGSTKGDIFSTELIWEAGEWDGGFKFTAVRANVKKGYVLGLQEYMPLASEAEAEALRTGKLDKSAVVAPSTSASASGKAADAKATGDALASKVDGVDGEVDGLKITGQGTQGRGLIIAFGGEEVGMDSDGVYGGDDRICWVFGQGDTAFATRADIAPKYDDETSHSYVVGQLVAYGDGGYDTKIYRCVTAHTATSWVSANWALATVEDVLAALRTGKADVSAIPYALVTKTISNNAVTLDDRASNAVTISTTLSPNTLTINFPTATSGKVRDFAMRLNIAAGVTAPEIAWPQGITLENNDGEVPEIADGGTGGSSTILYFSETENNGTTAKFLVKGETLAAITQA